MREPKFPQLPFVTREMLDWGSDATIELVITHASAEAITFDVKGATRQQVISTRVVAAAASVFVETTIGLDDFPIFLTTQVFNGVVGKGDLFISIQLRVNGDTIATLVNGYLTSLAPLSYPTIQAQDNFPETMPVNRDEFADPAAGAELTDTSPTQEWREIMAVRAILVTDANAADRRPHFIFRDGNNEIFCEVWASVEQIASTTRNYILMPIGVIPDPEDDNDIIVPIPAGLMMEPGGDILTDTTNFQATDNWGQSFVHYKRWMGRVAN